MWIVLITLLYEQQKGTQLDGNTAIGPNNPTKLLVAYNFKQFRESEN